MGTSKEHGGPKFVRTSCDSEPNSKRTKVSDDIEMGAVSEEMGLVVKSDYRNANAGIVDTSRRLSGEAISGSAQCQAAKPWPFLGRLRETFLWHKLSGSYHRLVCHCYPLRSSLHCPEHFSSVRPRAIGKYAISGTTLIFAKTERTWEDTPGTTHRALAMLTNISLHGSGLDCVQF